MPVRLGFIGCGNAAALHWDALASVEDARPVAFCDGDGPRAAAAARRFGGQAYATPVAMFARETLDAVYVCLPPGAHGDAELLTARAGCALFAEVPLSHTLKAAEKVATALDNAKVVATVGYQWRYSDAVTRLQKLLSARGAASPHLLAAHWQGVYARNADDRRAPVASNLVVEQGTHLCDLLRLLGGDVRRVTAIGAKPALRRKEDVHAPDAVGALLEFASGAVGSLTMTGAPGGVCEERVALSAADTLYELSAQSLTLRTPEETRTFPTQSEARVELNRAFIHAVKTGRRSGLKCPYGEALKTLRLTLAIQHAAKSGKPVMV